MKLLEGHAYQAELLLLRFLEDYAYPPHRKQYREHRSRILALLEAGLAAEWCDTCGGRKTDCGPHCTTKGDDTP